MKRSLFAALITLLSLPHARAELPVAEEQVSLQFRLMAWGGDVPELTYGRQQKIELTESGTRSSVQNYTGPVALSFTIPPLKPDPKKPAPVVASVVFPKDAKKVTLLTAPSGRGRFGMYVIPDDPAGLPPKHARLHNFSSERLLVGYNNGEQAELAPGASILAATAAPALVIRVARLVDGRWRELFNNVIELDPTVGTNVLLITGHQGGGIGMFAIPGWPAQPAPSKDIAYSGPPRR